jgi:uncharacterized membrane protein YhaH (DUF805 family)
MVKMIVRLDARVAALGRGSRRPLLVLTAALLATAALVAAEAAFRAVAGVPTPDTQDDLTATVAIAQISGYDAAAVRAYAVFAAVDVAFPVAVALLLAVLARRLADLGPRRASGRPLVPPALALLCLAPAVADLAENVALVTAVTTGGDAGAVAAALVAKAAKLAAIPAAAGVVVAFAALALTGLAQRRRSARV